MSSTPVLGFHCSHEQLPPSVLLRHVRLAEEAGFTAAMCSDHFHPWSERQGQSGFAWTWLGAALQATSLTFGTVCAPGQRYHPAVIAQAAATLAEMYSGRFWLAVGSGEALNESITGQGWPGKTDRNRRLQECVEIMRALWGGETVTRRGSTTTVDARLYTRPERPPLIVAAALTPETARWAGSWADALITVGGTRDAMRQMLDAFREGGGGAKPVFLQVALSCAPTLAECERMAVDQWRQAALETASLAEIATPAEFDRASRAVNPAEVIARIRCAPDIDAHIERLAADGELGFERIYLHNVARNHQEWFIEQCAARLLPAFAGGR
jgi:coenzyme F420-dependent glucose-6-phosphate dehydrogenase